MFPTTVTNSDGLARQWAWTDLFIDLLTGELVRMCADLGCKCMVDWALARESAYVCSSMFWSAAGSYLNWAACMTEHGCVCSQLSESEQRIALGQMMMQSLYDDRERSSRMLGYPAAAAPHAAPATPPSPAQPLSSSRAGTVLHVTDSSLQNPNRVPTIPPAPQQNALQRSDGSEASSSSSPQSQLYARPVLHWQTPAGVEVPRMQPRVAPQLSHNPDSGFFLAEGEHSGDVSGSRGAENRGPVLRRGGSSGAHSSHLSRQQTDQALELADLSARNTQDVEAAVESLLRHVQ